MVTLKCGPLSFEIGADVPQSKQTWRKHLAMAQIGGHMYPWAVGLMSPSDSCSDKTRLYFSMTYMPPPLEVAAGPGGSIQLQTRVPQLLVPFHTLGTPHIDLPENVPTILINDMDERDSRLKEWFFNTYQAHFAKPKIVAPSAAQLAQIQGRGQK